MKVFKNTFRKDTNILNFFILSPSNTCVKSRTSNCVFFHIVLKWWKHRTVRNLPKSNNIAKLTEEELSRLNRAVYRNRSLTSRKLKFSLNLRMSNRSI